jgi:hypothetical protein
MYEREKRNRKWKITLLFFGANVLCGLLVLLAFLIPLTSHVEFLSWGLREVIELFIRFGIIVLVLVVVHVKWYKQVDIQKSKSEKREFGVLGIIIFINSIILFFVLWKFLS